ncbi:MAG: hypothetical protein Q9216_002381 [Gyalolechia sp. 2 TL-2023]
MGISGLLPLLKSIQKPCNLKKFAGQTIGVDAYGWLHRGTVACAIDLALGTPTTKFVDFSMSRVRMLIHFGVKPYLVFDGDYLPSKAATEAERRNKREESKRLGLELYRMGKVSQAQQELQKAVDVTPEMARQFIEELKAIGVEYVVAPYEADAQLAYLEKKGLVQGILSEDSDLLVFGAKRLLTKLDQHGDCVEISRDDFTSCREISLVGWTDADFRRMAILSGCDYLANINKMGLKTAYRLVRKYKTIEKILRMLQFDGQYHVPSGYLEAFQRAELTFLHQRVFCPMANGIVMMTLAPAGCSYEKLDFLGAHVEKETGLGVATGDLHPMTKKPIVFKSKISQSPRTPWTNTRRQTAVTPSNLKPNKSIDSFVVKAHRTPLAELDPNSFTPSPSQQRSLHRTNGSWMSSPAPARASIARPTTLLPLSDSRSNGIRSSVHLSAGSFSAPHAPKRRRLCPDPEEATQNESVATERSKFFPATKTCPSPSVKGRGRKARSKAADFNIWSDDSIEEAMVELPDVTQSKKSPGDKALVVFNDEEGGGGKQSLNAGFPGEDKSTDSQSSTTSRSTLTSEISTCTSSTTIAGSAVSQSPAQTLDLHVQSELATLRKEYLYQPEPERCKVQRQEIVNGRTQVEEEEKPRLQRKGSMTPLQRLGASALNRSYSCQSSLNRTEEPQTHSRRKNPKGQLPKLADVLGSSSQPAATAAKVTVVNGSEDLMVPDSEAESEGSQEGEDDGRGKPGLDLGRFAFGG